jgi:multidrug resistance efflux pump
MTRPPLAAMLALLLAAAAAPPAARASALEVEGEVVALRSRVLSPPAIDDAWVLNITQLAPDGSRVRAGQPVVGFDGGQLTQTLVQRRSALAEKRSAAENLVLQLAERERTEALATEQARAERDKAALMAEQPADAIPGIEYRKLVIERERTARRLALMEAREAAGARQRVAERRLAEAEEAQIASEVERAERGLASLQLLAPEDGIFLHRTSWRGERFAVGSQVFRGQSVAEIPDLASLAVRVPLPERELTRVGVGTRAVIRVEGGAGERFEGSVVRVSDAVRSRSAAQPVPVVDLQVDFAVLPEGLRPGQPVRVTLEVAE